MKETTSRQIEGHTHRIFGVEFSPDGTLCATSAGDGKIFIWDTADWRQIRSIRSQGDSGYSRALAFSSDGQFISASQDGCVVMYAISTGNLAHQWPLPVNYPASWLRFSADGLGLMASVSEDEDYGFGPSYVCQWNSREPTRGTSVSFDGIVCDLRQTSADKFNVYVYFANDDSRVLRILDAGTGEVLREFDLMSCRAGGVPVISADARWIGLGNGCFASNVAILDACSGRVIASISSASPALPCIAFSDDKLFVTIDEGAESGCKAVSIATGAVMWSGVRGASKVEQLIPSPSGDVIASLMSDSTACFWNASDGAPLGSSRTHRQPGLFSPDGRWLLTLGASMRVTDMRSLA